MLISFHVLRAPTTAVPKMLEKRDSRSLEGVMRSVLLTEKLKNALQDNKSQSMDECMFHEKVVRARPKDTGPDGPEDSPSTGAADSEVRIINSHPHSTC